jgi:hypothetical protein
MAQVFEQGGDRGIAKIVGHFLILNVLIGDNAWLDSTVTLISGQLV